MDWERLEKEITEKILGWEFCKSSFEQYDPSCWVDTDGKQVWGPDFRPSQDIRAAWVLIEKLRAMRPNCLTFYVMSSPGGNYMVVVNHQVKDSYGTWRTKKVLEIVEDTAPKAICLAAARAWSI